MRKLPALLSLCVVTFSFITLLQVSLLHALAAPEPLTPPVTPPLTSFMLKISGKIVIKHIQWLHFFSKFIPLDGATVKLENIKTHDKQTVQTDSSGAYSFFVTDPGWYKVSPIIGRSTAEIVAPPLRFVPLSKHDKLHEDFQAIDLP